MKNSHPTLCSVLSLLAASLFTTAAGFIDIAFAQSATATLRGTVVDEQGAVVRDRKWHNRRRARPEAPAHNVVELA